MAATSKLAGALDIRDFGAECDATWNGSQSVGTDDSAAFQSCIDAAIPGQRIIVPKDTLAVNLSIRKPLTIQGHGQGISAGHEASSIIAPPGSSGWILDIDRNVGDPWITANHISAINLQDISLDGNARTTDTGGASLRLLQRSQWSNVNIRHFQRSGLWFRFNDREMSFHGLEVKFCGTAGQWNAVEFLTEASTPGDGHNNIDFYTPRIVANLGTVMFNIEGDDAATAPSPLRGVRVFGGLFHGEPSSVMTPDLTGSGDYTGEISDVLPVTIRDAREIFFIGTRVHLSGPSHPLVSIGGSSTDATPVNVAGFTNVSFGVPGNGDAPIQYDWGSHLAVMGCSANVAPNYVNNPNNRPVQQALNTWGPAGGDLTP